MEQRNNNPEQINYDNLHQIWDVSHENNSPVFRLRSAVLLGKIPEANAGESALDAGCGTGFYSKALLQKNYKVDAFDLSSYAINLLPSKLSSEEAARFFPVVADIFTYKPSHNPYMVIVLSEVLEHIEDDHAALTTITRYLDESGQLIISVPIGPELYSIDDQLSGHVRRYTMPELEKLINSCGLRIVKKHYYGFPAIYIYMLWKRFFFKKENYDKLVSNTSKSSSKSRIYQLISDILVYIDQCFLWVNRGVGTVLVVKKL